MSTTHARSTEYGDRVTLPSLAAALTAAIAVSVIAGWTFRIPALKSVIPGAVDMQPITALAMLLAAAALNLLAGNATPRRMRIGQVLAVLVALLGFATLTEYVFDVSFGLDGLMFTDTASIPGRISPYTAVSLACIGLALGALAWPAMRAFVWIVTLPVVMLGAVSMFGYVWGSHALVIDRWLPPMAVNTAAAFVVIGAGTLAATLHTDERPVTGDPRGAPERRVLAGSVATLVVVLAAGIFTYRAAADLASSTGELARSQALRQAARHLYGSVAGAQAAQRGYLLTGDARLRAAYARHESDIDANRRALAQFARPEQGSAVNEVETLVGRALPQLAGQMEIFERDGEAAAKQAVVAAPGTELAQAIFDATERVADAEEAWLAKQESAAVRSRLLTLLSLLLTLTVATGALLVLFRGIRREMAARAASERAVREAHRFCDSVIENIPDTVFVKDARDLKYVRINRAGEELIGQSRSDMTGKSDHEVYPPEIAERFIRQDREALALGGMVDIPQETFPGPDGSERLLHTKKIPILDQSGRPQYLLGISQDVTERRRQEQQVRALNASLSQRAAEVEAANKELESFSYSVSHDLRAPLRHVSGYVQLLTESLEDKLEEEPRRFLRVISDASRQMSDLIDDLLAFSRMARTGLHQTRLDLEDIVRDVISGLEMDTRARRIDWQVGPLPPVEGDPAMLKLVYGNLLGNAVKYSAPRETARIEIGAAGEEGDRAVLFVRDNGVGFDMKYAGKLFGIFQRLHPAEEFEGTGIGLATVQRIVARHGGRVWAEAAPNEGAAFYFTLRKSEAGPVSH